MNECPKCHRLFKTFPGMRNHHLYCGVRHKKIMQSMGDRNYLVLLEEANRRGCNSVQELLRAVVIPWWFRERQSFFEKWILEDHDGNR